MTRSAAGVDYNPFQFFQRLVLTRPREVYYIGGSDVLPAPLEPRRGKRTERTARSRISLRD